MGRGANQCLEFLSCHRYQLSLNERSIYESTGNLSKLELRQ